jgi:hypothetical protein
MSDLSKRTRVRPVTTRSLDVESLRAADARVVGPDRSGRTEHLAVRLLREGTDRATPLRPRARLRPEDASG